MKKSSFSLLDEENSEHRCEQKVEELKQLRSKYGFLKNYYVAPSSKKRQKLTISSNFSQISSKNPRTSPLLKIKTTKLKSLISSFDSHTPYLSSNSGVFPLISQDSSKLQKSSLLRDYLASQALFPAKQGYFLQDSPKPLETLANVSEKSLISPLVFAKKLVQPLESFDQGLITDESPAKRLANGPIAGFSLWKAPDGRVSWKDCVILEHFPESSEFLIEWLHNHKKKKVTRLNLMFSNENPRSFEERRAFAQEKRDISAFYAEIHENLRFQVQNSAISVPEAVIHSIFSKIRKPMSLRQKASCLQEIKENFLYNLHKFLNKAPTPIISAKNCENSPISHDFHVVLSNPPQRDSLCSLKLDKPLKNDWESAETVLFPLYFRAKPLIFTIEIRSNEDSESRLAVSKTPSSLAFFKSKEPEIFCERHSFKGILKDLEAQKPDFQRLCEKKLLFSLDHMILANIMQIKEIDFFEVFSPETPGNTPILCRAAAEIHDKVFEISRLINKIEKVLDTFLEDLQISAKSAAGLLFHQHFSKKANIFLESCLQIALKSSISRLREKLSPVFSQSFPFRKLLENCKDLRLSFETRAQKLRNREIPLHSFEFAHFREEIRLISLFSREMHRFFCEHPVPAPSKPVLPLFKTKLFLQKDTLDRKKPRKSASERRYQRNWCRTALKKLDSSILQHFLAQNEETFAFTAFEDLKTRFSLRSVTFWHLGYASLSGFCVKFEPSLDIFEETLKKTLRGAVLELETLGKVFAENARFSFVQEKELLRNFSQEIDCALLLSLYGPYALLAVISLFEYYFTQKKTFLADITENFEDVTSIFLEYEHLCRDLDFFRVRLPKTLNFALLSVDLQEIARSFCEILEEYVSALRAAVSAYFFELLQKNQQAFDRLRLSLSKAPSNLQLHIELSQYLSSEVFVKEKLTLHKNQEIARELHDILEKMSCELAETALELFFETLSFSSTLELKETEVRSLLSERKTRFRSSISQENQRLLEDFSQVSKKIAEFQRTCETESTFFFANEAKALDTELESLINKAALANENERILGYAETDFSEIKTAKDSFKNTASLWTFLEKWHFKTEGWLNATVKSIDEKDMLFTIKEGISLLNYLEERFSSDLHSQELITRTFPDIHRFNEYLQVILLLKSESFKEEHWEFLIKELSKGKKPVDFSRTALKELVTEYSLMKNCSLIYKLAYEAQLSYKLGLEISKLEAKIKETVFRGEETPLGHIFIKEIEKTQVFIEEFHACASFMNTNAKLRQVYAEKLSEICWVLKKTKEFLKFFVLLQRKVRLLLRENIVKIKELHQFKSESLAKLLTEHQKHAKKLISKNMGYFFYLFEKTEEKDATRQQEKTLETIPLVKSLLTSLQVLENSLFEAERARTARLLRLSQELLLDFLLAEPAEIRETWHFVYPGLRALLFSSENEKIQGFVLETGESLAISEDSQSQVPANNVDLLNLVDIEARKLVKSQFFQALATYFSTTSGFLGLWKALQSRVFGSQAGLLALELIFCHEVAENAGDQASFRVFSKKTQATLEDFLQLRPKKQFARVFEAFLLKLLGNLEFLRLLQSSGAPFLETFDFLAFPKLFLRAKLRVPALSPAGLLAEGASAPENCEIVLQSLHFEQKYGFHIINPLRTALFCTSPAVPRLFFNFLQTLHLRQGLLLSSNSQKKAFKALATRLARPVFDEIRTNCLRTFQIPLKIAQNTDFFLIFSMKTADFTILSQISLYFIRKCGPPLALDVRDWSQKTPLFHEFPKILLEKFRNVQIHEVHLCVILENLLFLTLRNHEISQEIARKLAFFCELLRNSVEVLEEVRDVPEFSAAKTVFRRFSWEILVKAVKEVRKTLTFGEDPGVFAQKLWEKLEAYFENRVDARVLQGIARLFEKLFGKLQKSDTVDSTNHKEIAAKATKQAIISEFLKKKRLFLEIEIDADVAAKLEDFLDFFEESAENRCRVLTLAGPCNFGKSLIIKLFAHFFAETKGNFLIHSLKLDALEPVLMDFHEKIPAFSQISALFSKKPAQKSLKLEEIPSNSWYIVDVPADFPAEHCDLQENLLKTLRTRANSLIILKAETLKSATPAFLFQTSLKTLQMPVFSLQQGFTCFLNSQAFSKCSYLQRFSCFLSRLFSEIFVQILEFLLELPSEFLLFRSNPQQLSRNFQSFLLIQLNEFRKLAFSRGLYTDDSSSFFPQKSKKRSSQVFKENFSQTPLSPSLRHSPRNNTQRDHDMFSRLANLFLFSAISALDLVQPRHKSRTLEPFLEKLLRNHEFSRYFRDFLEVSNKFDSIFELICGKWLEFSAIPEHFCEKINTDLRSNALKTQEIVKFNPDLQEIESVRTQLASETSEKYLFPTAHVFFDTRCTKKIRFFADLFVKYHRKFVLLGRKACGKSVFLDNLTFSLLSEGEFRVFKCFFQQSQSLRFFKAQLQPVFEETSSFRGLSLAGRQSLIILEDLHLAAYEIKGLLRSLLQEKGWFCEKKASFLRFCLKDLSIALTFSYKTAPFLKEIPQKLPFIVMDAPSLRDFEGIFRVYAESALKSELIDRKTRESLLKAALSLGFLYYKSQERLLFANTQLESLLSLNKCLNFVKNLALFDLSKENSAAVVLYLFEKHFMEELFPMNLAEIRENVEEVEETVTSFSSFPMNLASNREIDLENLSLSPKSPHSFKKRSILLESPYRRPVLRQSSKRISEESETKKTENLGFMAFLDEKFASGLDFAENSSKIAAQLQLFYKKLLLVAGLQLDSSFHPANCLVSKENMLETRENTEKNDSFSSNNDVCFTFLRETCDLQRFFEAFSRFFEEFQRKSADSQTNIPINLDILLEMTTELLYFFENKPCNLLIETPLPCLFLGEVLSFAASMSNSLVFSLENIENIENLPPALSKAFRKSFKNSQNLIILVHSHEKLLQILPFLQAILTKSEHFFLEKQLFRDFCEENRRVPAYKDLNDSHLLHFFKQKLQNIKVIIHKTRDFPRTSLSSLRDLGFKPLFLGFFPREIATNAEKPAVFDEKALKTLSFFHLDEKIKRKTLFKRQLFVNFRSCDGCLQEISALAQKLEVFLEKQRDSLLSRGVFGRILALKDAKLEKFQREIKKIEQESEKSQSFSEEGRDSYILVSLEKKRLFFEIISTDVFKELEQLLPRCLPKVANFLETRDKLAETAWKLACKAVFSLSLSLSHRRMWCQTAFFDNFEFVSLLLGTERFLKALALKEAKNQAFLEAIALIEALLNVETACKLHIYDPYNAFLPVFSKIYEGSYVLNEEISAVSEGNLLIIEEKAAIYLAEEAFFSKKYRENQKIVYISRRNREFFLESLKQWPSVYHIMFDLEDKLSFKEHFLDLFSSFASESLRKNLLEQVKSQLKMPANLENALEHVAKELEKLESSGADSVNSLKASVSRLKQTINVQKPEKNLSFFELLSEYKSEPESKKSWNSQVEPVIQGLWELKSTLQGIVPLIGRTYGLYEGEIVYFLKVLAADPEFSYNKVLHEVSQHLMRGLRLDHQIIAKFLLQAQACCTGKESEFQMNLLLNGRIEEFQDKQSFEDCTNERKWQEFQTFLRDFLRNSPKGLLAPLQVFSQKNVIFSLNSAETSIKIEKNALDLMFNKRNFIVKKRPLPTKMLSSVVEKPMKSLTLSPKPSNVSLESFPISSIIRNRQESVFFPVNEETDTTKTEDNLNNPSNFIKEEEFKDAIVEQINEKTEEIGSFSTKTQPISRNLHISIKKNLRNMLMDVRGKLKVAKSLRSTEIQGFLQTSVWKALLNVSSLIPQFRELLDDFSENGEKWKQFLVIPTKELRIFEENPFKNLSFLENLLLIKYIRPESLEYFINSRKGLFKLFKENTSENEEIYQFLSLSFLKACRRPVVCFHELESQQIVASLKAKILRLKENIFEICLLEAFEEDPELQDLRQAFREGKWVIVKGLNALSLERMRYFCKEMQAFLSYDAIKGRAFLLYQMRRGLYRAIDPVDLKEEMAGRMFSACHKVYFNAAESIKQQMNSVYSSEIEDFLLQPESNKFELPITSLLRHSAKKKQQVSPQKLANIETSLITQDLSYFLKKQDENLINLLNNNTEKLKFNLKFLYSLILQRKKTINLAIAYNTQGEKAFNLSYLPDTHFSLILDEIFSFLLQFKLSPFHFLQRALDFLFEETYPLQTNTSTSTLLKTFLMDYSSLDLEKQIIVDIKSYKYRLFNNYAAVSPEENLYKNIQSFPDEDPIEIFGLGLNDELLSQYEKSVRLMQLIKKKTPILAEKNPEKLIKKLQSGELEDPKILGNKIKETLIKQKLEEIKTKDNLLVYLDKINGFIKSFDLNLKDLQEVDDEESLVFSQENRIFKTLVINEYLCSSQLQKFITNDLEILRLILEGKEELTEYYQQIIRCVDEDSVPCAWKQVILWSHTENLQEFFRVLLLRMECLFKLISLRQCEVFPIIPLNKLFDPFHFIYSYLLQTSCRMNIIPLSLKLCLQRVKMVENKQNAANGIQISGFSLIRARLTDNNYLEEENLREFRHEMPTFLMTCQQKIHETKGIGLSFEIFEGKNSTDLEWEWELQKKNPVKFFNYETRKEKSLDSSIEGSMKALYYVRIPIITTTLKAFFFVKSWKPQEHWIKKETYIQIDCLN